MTLVGKCEPVPKIVKSGRCFLTLPSLSREYIYSKYGLNEAKYADTTLKENIYCSFRYKVSKNRVKSEQELQCTAYGSGSYIE